MLGKTGLIFNNYLYFIDLIWTILLILPWVVDGRKVGSKKQTVILWKR